MKNCLISRKQRLRTAALRQAPACGFVAANEYHQMDNIMHLALKSDRLSTGACVLLIFSLLSGCSSLKERTVDPEDIFVQSKLDATHDLDYAKKDKEKAAETKVAPPQLSLEQRMPKATSSEHIPSWVEKRKYHFRARNVSVRSALKMFAKNNQLNIYYEPEITGKVSVDFRDLPLKKAMQIILGSHGYYWQWQDNLIYVGKHQTRTYVIDYIRLTRGSKSNTSTSTASTSIGQNNTVTNSSISHDEQIAFWDELEKQLRSLVGEKGRLTVNRTTGNIQVTDTHPRIVEIDRFINDIKKAMHRQVLIEARIVEVELGDDRRFGVDWSAMDFLNFTGVTESLSSLVSNSIELKAATATLSYSDGRFKSMVSALSEQGSVKVMSQPRIRTMNNQPAIIKVGTDRTFFSTTATSTTSAGATQVITSELATVVTEGVVLSITPQISEDGKIMLDVSPVITRIKDVITSQFGSTAPVLDIKQTSTLIRANDGEMVVVGGLIQESKNDRVRRVPVLGSLPLIGKLFKSTSNSRQRTELVIFLVPKIIG